MMHSERIIDAGGVWRLETNFHVSRLNRAIGIPNIEIIQMLYSETRVRFEALKLRVTQRGMCPGIGDPRKRTFLNARFNAPEGFPYVGQDRVWYIVYIHDLTPCLSKSEPMGEPSSRGQKKRNFGLILVSPNSLNVSCSRFVL